MLYNKDASNIKVTQKILKQIKLVQWLLYKMNNALGNKIFDEKLTEIKTSAQEKVMHLIPFFKRKHFWKIFFSHVISKTLFSTISK